MDKQRLQEICRQLSALHTELKQIATRDIDQNPGGLNWKVAELLQACDSLVKADQHIAEVC